MSKQKKDGAPAVRITSEVVRQIRQHARSNSKTEVCGVLIGSDANGISSIEAAIAGVNAAQGGAHGCVERSRQLNIAAIALPAHIDGIGPGQLQQARR